MNNTDLMVLGYTAVGTLIIIILVTIIGLYVDNKKNKIIQREFSLIKEGDIYECKYDVNSYGLSRTNPYKQFRYKVISKKEGWIQAEAINVTSQDQKNTSIVHVSVKELLSKNYKCINNIR